MWTLEECKYVISEHTRDPEVTLGSVGSWSSSKHRRQQLARTYCKGFVNIISTALYWWRLGRYSSSCFIARYYHILYHSFKQGTYVSVNRDSGRLNNGLGMYIQEKCDSCKVRIHSALVLIVWWRSCVPD